VELPSGAEKIMAKFWRQVDLRKRREKLAQGFGIKRCYFAYGKKKIFFWIQYI
jgi:hypothetical protein